jgi:predicted O-methyltransferase YrrM
MTCKKAAFFLSVLLLSLELPLAAAPGRSFSDIRQALSAFQESRILLTAVELNIFTAVSEGATAEQVAAKLGTHTRATETFLNALVALETLTKTDRVFHNTAATARYLVDGSPDNARAGLMHTAQLWPAWSTLTECVRTGTAVAYEEMAGRDREWMQDFIAAMHRGGLAGAPRLVQAVGTEGVSRMLDIGGGSGVYSIAFAKASKDLRAEVLDLPSVVPIAQRYIEEAGLAGRVTTRVGDLRKDDFGRNYDLALLSAICHMLSPQENKDLFRRCYKALAPKGRIVIRDFILEPDKTAPKWVAIFALNMLVATQGGGTYTEQEYAVWLREAGFRNFTRFSDDLIVASQTGDR